MKTILKLVVNNSFLLVLCLWFTPAVQRVTAATPGKVAAWGNGGFGVTSVPTNLIDAVAIAPRNYGTIALKKDGTVVGWGANGYVPAGLPNLVAISTSWNDITVGMESNGNVVAWGDMGSYSFIPFSTSGLTAIAAGGAAGSSGFILALTTNGTVTVWSSGNNYYGETNVPVGLTNVVAIAAGYGSGAALKSNGTVVAWGYNNYGQTNVPSGLSNVVAISEGIYNMMALKANGTVVAWGDNTYGETNVPVGLTNVVAIAAGFSDMVALKNDGTVVVWGDNSSGQTNIPIGLSEVTGIAAGGAIFAISVAQPNITAQPQSLAVNVTSNVTFSVTATGTPLLSYQWYYNTNTPLANATNATLTLANVQTNQAGRYTVIITNAWGNSVTSDVAVLTVNRFTQTISFGTLSAKLVGDAPFTLNATASSGLPVSYTNSNSNVATLSGNTVTITSIGSTTITAIQAGNATYQPAANVSQTLAVSLPTVHFTANPTFGGVPLTVQFTAPNIDSGNHAISQWNWTFGDGSTSTAQNPSHIYTTVGNLSPSLIATIPYGNTVVASGPSITGLYLLLNGGFETGDFSSWTSSGNFTSCSVVTGSLYAHSGTYGSEFGPAGPALAYLSQLLPTAAGGIYTLSFWLDSPDGLTPNEFSVAWNGTTLMDKKSFGAVGWTNIQFVVTASGTNTLLQFGFRNDNSFFGLDDISVVPAAHPVIAGIHLSGTNLVLNGSSGLSGATYYTQMSTNLIQWIPVATNVIGANGNFTITATNVVKPINRQGYYRFMLGQ